MISSTSIPLSFVAAAALALAPLAAGCTAGPAPETGDVMLMLTQPGPHGEIYHLGNATFDIVHNETGEVTTVDGGGLGAQVDVSVSPGIVFISLRDGWTLEKSTDGGASFQPVSALLGSPNPNIVRVLANQLSFVQFAFLIRQTNGTLGITLGVVANPRELAGGIVIDSATDELAPYALAANRTFDFGAFFNLVSVETSTLDDGTHQRTYTAFGQQGSFGPVPLPTAALGIEFYNDSVGTFAGPIARELTGGFLTYTVAARPGGTVDVAGSLIGGATDIEFGPTPIDVTIPSIDADGFPGDEFFYASQVAFTQTSQQGTATGLLRVRQLLEAP